MNAANQRVLGTLRRHYSDFLAGSLDAEDLRSRVETAAPLAENDGSGLAQDLRRLAADLEAVYFTNPKADHRALSIELVSEFLRQH